MPKIKTKRLMVRGKTDREWNTIPAAGSGVYPVVKTDAMTAEIGRDAQGRLWTAGTGRGIENVYVKTVGDGQYLLYIMLEYGGGYAVAMPRLEPDEFVQLQNRAPAAEDTAKYGTLWADLTTEKMYVAIDGNSGGIYVPGLTAWMPVGGAGGVVKNIYVRTLTNESTGQVGYMLVVENSNGTQTLTKLPDATIVSNVEPDAAKTDNGVFWYDQDTDKLYINFSGWRKIYDGSGSGLPEYTDTDEGKVLGIVNGKPAWVTVQTAPAEEIVLAVNEDGSVYFSGVELAVQDDGAVLVGGASVALQDDGAVLIK